MEKFYFFIAATTIFDVIGIISAKLWHINKNPLFIVSTCLFFGLAGYMFARSVRFESIGIANAIWGGLSAILIVASGYILFKENIAPIQIFGIAAIVIGLVLVNLK